MYPYTQWFCWSLSLLNGYNWGYTPFSDIPICSICVTRIHLWIFLHVWRHQYPATNSHWNFAWLRLKHFCVKPAMRWCRKCWSTGSLALRCGLTSQWNTLIVEINPHYSQVLVGWLTVSEYPLVNKHNYGKSPFFMGKSTINGDFQ